MTATGHFCTFAFEPAPIILILYGQAASFCALSGLQWPFDFDLHDLADNARSFDERIELDREIVRIEYSIEL